MPAYMHDKVCPVQSTVHTKNMKGPGPCFYCYSCGGGGMPVVAKYCTVRTLSVNS